MRITISTRCITQASADRLCSGFAAAGAGLNYVPSVGRPFSLLDLSISFPVVPQSVSVVTLALVALFAPAVIIVLISLLLVPGKLTRRSLSRGDVVRRKLWELHSGLAGLALAVALAFFVTQGLKEIFGKLRPHLLALCQPDLNNISEYVVGGFGQDMSVRWTLVSKSICQQLDARVLNDGFRSFPSGHASFSWSGLLYLSFFLSSKFAITIPHLSLVSPRTAEPNARVGTAQTNDTELLPLHNPDRPTSHSSAKSPSPPLGSATVAPEIPLYNHAAAPPNYGIVIVLIPLAAAAYITATRYFEFWHFGVDVGGGAIIGIISAWFSFRWYHTPIRRGAGWAWGARSRDRAFGIGVGTGSYVGPEGWSSAS